MAEAQQQTHEAFPVDSKPELVLGVVAPAGISYGDVEIQLSAALHRYGYRLEPIKLSSLLHKWAGATIPGDEFERVQLLQQTGSWLREETADGAALAVEAIVAVVARRGELGARPDGTVSNVVWVLWSLKHQAEMALLRSLYGDRFYSISLYRPEDVRHQELMKLFHRTRLASTDADRLALAKVITSDDEQERGSKLGQQTRRAYAEADFFVDISRTDPDNKPTLDDQIDRVVKIIFGAPFVTPTRDEYAMKLASVAEYRSAELGRQVGAAITNTMGDVIAIGTNEVPKASGGQYWEEDSHDEREFQRNAEVIDPAKRYPREISEQLFERLKGTLSDHYELELPEGFSAENFQALVNETRIGDLIEFGRAVHAEMAALTTAARLGHAIQGCTVYSTTFPCHECSRHIIVSGIERLVFIHPYPKSLAIELHDDAIVMEDAAPGQTPRQSNGDERPVCRFDSFIGVAPKMYDAAFRYPETDRRAVGALGRAEDSTEAWPRKIADRVRPLARLPLGQVGYPAHEQVVLADWAHRVPRRDRLDEAMGTEAPP